MCGIVGYIGKGNQEILKRMADSLKHRGPDDEGFYIKDNLGLGHRRLSIIDLAGGHQPLSNEDETIWLVFNGEIYNFPELRERLKEKGHRFRTKTDCEVIVHLYEEEGENLCQKLNGMFAFALWDGKERKLILARDRLGKKPLFYSFVQGSLVFASELRALFEHPAIKKEIDFESLNKYLLYEYVPAPYSLIKGVDKLEPGQILTYQDGRLGKDFYWDVKFRETRDHQGHLKIFEELLEAAVKKRLVADVPLGVFLSGGIDSSTVAYYAQKNSAEKIKTFSIGFEDKSFDESNYALRVARFLGTDHHHQKFIASDLLDSIEEIAKINDEPLADASIVPTYLLSKFARQAVKVALGGDGGDEIFAGYPTFQALKIAKLLCLFPDFLREFFEKAASRLPVSHNYFSFEFKLKRLLSGWEYPLEIQNQIWQGSFSPKESKKILLPEISCQMDFSESFSEIERLLKNVEKEPLENRIAYLYLKQYLANDILVKADKASMFASLELRAPFLDYQLVEFANSLPYRWKIRGWTTKYILKRLMKDKLPKEIVFRRKKGFGVPVAQWLNKELKGFALALLNKEALQKQGIFNCLEVGKLLNEHFSKKADHRKKIWTLLMFQQWFRRWL